MGILNGAFCAVLDVHNLSEQEIKQKQIVSRSQSKLMVEQACDLGGR